MVESITAEGPAAGAVRCLSRIERRICDESEEEAVESSQKKETEKQKNSDVYSGTADCGRSVVRNPAVPQWKKGGFRTGTYNLRTGK